MNYNDIVKHLVDNFVFTTIEKEFYFNEEHFDGKRMISGPSHIFWEFFDWRFYERNGQHFHDINMINFLKSYKIMSKLDYELAMIQKKKKIILEMSLHPCSDSLHPHQTMKEKFIDILFKDKELLNKMRKGELFLLLYQGWEPQNFTEKTRETDTIDSYYEIFDLVFKQYNLPSNSIILMGSNIRNIEYKKQFKPNLNKVSTIIDNFMEVQSFCAIPNNTMLDMNYSFEEHIKNIKKSDKTLLRLSRTHNDFRNLMLYFIYHNNFEDRSIIEHRKFDLDYAGCSVPEVFNVDTKVLNKIYNDIPMVASKFEIGKDVENYSNQAIPYDVYKNTIFSWCSSSLPEQIDKVYLSQSTFNPMLFYHPIVWHAQPYHIKCLKKYGYKTYDWLFDESADSVDEYEWKNDYIKLRNNFKDISNVMNMDRNKLIDKLKENKETLEHNRNLLIQCKSIERIITKFYETTI